MHAADPGRLTLAQHAALGLIRAYKGLFAGQFAGSCRFMPSCSEYAAEALKRYGVARGSLLALRRLSRCHPLGSSGYDPVPLPVKPSASSTQVPPQI